VQKLIVKNFSRNLERQNIVLSTEFDETHVNPVHHHTLRVYGKVTQSNGSSVDLLMTDKVSAQNEKLDQMLEEVAGYSVELETDPTLPHLGKRYLHDVLSKCRNYTNRTLFYLQNVMRQEKELKREIKQLELDLEFKMSEKLADDAMVRAQPSIEDRKAVAASFLKDENIVLAQLRVDLIDVQETAKILKMRYNDLQRTSNDIKLQRTIVKDDVIGQMDGGGGFEKPQLNQDKSVRGGLTAPISMKPVDPKDILDPAKRPADMPEPKDESDAGRIAAFLSRHPEKDAVDEQVGKDGGGVEYYTGKHCLICKKPQFNTHSGVTCDLGHGGAESVEDTVSTELNRKTPIAFDNVPETLSIDYSSLLD
jgi:hypothetical protein